MEQTGDAATLRRPGETLLVGRWDVFRDVAPHLLITNPQAMRSALHPYLRDDAARAALATMYRRIACGNPAGWQQSPEQVADHMAGMAAAGAIAAMALPQSVSEQDVPPTAVDATALVQPTTPVAQWATEQRFAYALQHAPDYMPAAVATQFRQLTSPTTIRTVVAVLVIWATSHAVGAGEIMDAILIAVGVVLAGWSIFDALGSIARFFNLTLGAKTTHDLDEAAHALADATVELGAAVLIALLTRGAGRLAKRIGKNRIAPRSAEPTRTMGSSPDTAAPGGADQAPARVSSKPAWLQKLDAGNDFNRAQAPNYPYNEVYVDKPSGDGYFRLDSYNPDSGEIVSRKFTQLSDIQESTANSYINEIPSKYPVGATVADVPSSGTLAGSTLHGQYVLEVPPQVNPVPQGVLNSANQAGVLIRDTNGHVY
jgi:hypothetical protein